MKQSKGFTLIELAIVLVVIGIVVGLGIPMIGTLVKKQKLNASRDVARAAKEAVSGFAVKNKRLPTSAEFPTIVRNLDAWGNTLVYYADTNLVSGNACCSAAAGFTVTDQGTNKESIAFIVYSLGADGTDDTSNPNPPPPSYIISEQSDDYDDIPHYVSIEELKSNVLSCEGLEIVTSSLPSAEEDAPYTTTLTSRGGCSPTFSLQSGNLPSGLTLAADGTISGTTNIYAGTAGTLSTCTSTNNFTVRLSSDGFNPVDKDLSIIVKPHDLRITNTTLPGGATGASYSATIYPAGGDSSAYDWTPGATPCPSSGSLPGGLSCNQVGDNAVIDSGTPSTAGIGISSFAVTLGDSCTTTTKAFTTTIADSCFSSGISVLNATGWTRYYRRGGGACTAWANQTYITVLPINNYRFYRNSTRCNQNRRSCSNITYSFCQGYDADIDCQISLTGIANWSCTFGDL